MALIVVNAIAFGVEVIASHSLTPGIADLKRLGAAYGPLTMQGEWWRLLTSTFLHGGVLHIVLNMWTLFNVGLLAEMIFGRRNYLLLYLSCGLGGSILSLWWHPAVVSVGASGAIFGVAGALLPAIFFEQNPQVRRALRSSMTSIAIFVFFNLAYGAGVTGIDNAAHVGGLATGLLLGWLLPTATHPDFRQKQGRALIFFAAVAIVMVGAAAGARVARAGTLHFIQAMDLYSAGNRQEAIKEAQLAVKQDPKLVDGHYLLGTLLMADDRNEEAIPELKATVELEPKFADAHSQLCIAYIRSNRVEEAVASCKRAVQLTPTSADYQFNLGLVYRADGQKGEALEAFRQAYKLKPQSLENQFDYALALIDDGQRDAGIKELQDIVAKHPQFEPAKQKLEDAQAHSSR